VTLVEYGDYQCPYCGQAEVVIRELLDSFGDELRYVWRHLPLNDVHANAQLAAEAPSGVRPGRVLGVPRPPARRPGGPLAARAGRHAEELGLDTARFWAELKSHEHAERIGDDVTSADASGVAGTPSFFINGQRYDGEYDVATLTRVVRTARQRARVRAAAESPPRGGG
jgi:protein-disulfide isomerase